MLQFYSILLMFTNMMWVNCSVLKAGQKTDLSGAHLTFAFFDVPPFNVLKLNPDGNYTHSGSIPLVCAWLADKLNFTFSYVDLNNTIITLYGSNIKLATELVVNKEVDGIAVALLPTPERTDKMDFAHFIWMEPHTLIVPRQGEEPRLFAFIWPFQPTVWLVILVTILTVIFSMSLFSRIYNGALKSPTIIQVATNQQEKSVYYFISDCSIYIINTLTNQGGRDPLARFSFRILAGVWLLVAMVLVNSYAGTVISYLTFPKMKPPINSFEDLAAREDINLIILRNTVIGQQLLEAKSGAQKILGDQIKQNSDRQFGSLLNIIDRLQTGRYAFPHLQSFSKFFVVNQFRKDGECRFQSTDPLHMSGFWSFAMQKDSKYTSALSVALTELWETGLPSFWVKNLAPPAPKCFAKIKPRATMNPMQSSVQLKDLEGIFLILGVGVAASIPAFLLELLVFKRSRQ